MPHRRSARWEGRVSYRRVCKYPLVFRLAVFVWHYSKWISDLLKKTFGRNIAVLALGTGIILYTGLSLHSGRSQQISFVSTLIIFSLYFLFRMGCVMWVTFLVFLLNVSDGLMYWQEKQEDSKPNDNPWWRPYYRPRSADIEITAYALLAFSLNKDISAGLSISRWLSQQRNSLGGYSSTQVLSII